MTSQEQVDFLVAAAIGGAFDEIGREVNRHGLHTEPLCARALAIAEDLIGERLESEVLMEATFKIPHISHPADLVYSEGWIGLVAARRGANLLDRHRIRL